MPSPLSHLAVGYVVYRAHRALPGPRLWGRLPVLLLAALGLAVLPDADAILGILKNDLGQFHNGWSHSLIIGLCVAVVAGAAGLFSGRARARSWFLIALLCYESHVVMDFFTIGRGVMALWPISTERFSSPVSLFYGLHWSDGWLSLRHLWTLVTELAFVGVVGAVVWTIDRLRSGIGNKRTAVTQ